MTERTKAEIQIAAEASLIGSVLAKREHMMYLGGITIDHFIDKAHARAWQRLLSDVSITDELSLQLNDNELSDAHVQRIAASRHGQATVIRARDYLIERRRIREIRRIATEALTALDEDGARSEMIAINLNRAVQEMEVAQSASMPAKLVAQNLKQKGNSKPISTGLASLDYVLHGGLHVGLLTGIFARYKHGKTLLTATIAHNLERQGIPTQVITLERREGDLERFIAARCLNVDKQDLNFDDPHTQSFWEDYCATDRCLHYLHRPGITIDELRSQILSAHFAHGIKVVLVDYWQLIKIIGTKQNRSEQQYDSAQMLANLASELDIAIVMTGQLNQDGIPQYGEGVLAAAGIVVRIQRPDDQEYVFFDTLVSNQGPGRSKGNPSSPAASIALPGPHFQDYKEAA
jgi:replicative DNA helicase